MVVDLLAMSSTVVDLTRPGSMAADLPSLGSTAVHLPPPGSMMANLPVASSTAIDLPPVGGTNPRSDSGCAKPVCSPVGSKTGLHDGFFIF